MAAIMVLSVGAMSVSAATPQPRTVKSAAPGTVGGPITGAPSGMYDYYWGTYWWTAQGGPGAHGYNIYYQNPQFGSWIPVATGSNPSIASDGYGNEWIALRGPSGAPVVLQTSNDGATWKSVSLPSGAPTVLPNTGPVMVYTASNDLIVLYTSSTRNLIAVDIDLTTGTGSWTNLGGIVFDTPAAAATSTGNGVVVVVAGTGGRIYEQTFNTGGNWSGWLRPFHDGLIGAGAALVSDVGLPTDMFLVVSGTDSHLYVLESDNDGYTWMTVNAYTGHGSHTSLYWMPQTGTLTASVTAYTSGPGGCYVDTRGGDGNIWENALTFGFPYYVTAPAPSIPTTGTGFHFEENGP